MKKQLRAFLGGAAVWHLAVGLALAAPADEAQQIASLAGFHGGLAVHVGCGDGQLTAALRLADNCVVQGLEADAKRVETARATIRARGLYGPVSVLYWNGKTLPYVDNLAALVVCEDPSAVPAGELLRVLRPHGALVVKRNGQWTVTLKPKPDDVDEWQQHFHGPDNNAVAQDSVVGPPRRYQWLDEPEWQRAHGYQDQGQTPNTQIALMEFDHGWLLFEVRGLKTKGGVGNNCIFDEKASVAPIKIQTVPGVQKPGGPRGPGGSNIGNFIACVRSRRSEDLNNHILEGHYSSALCHLANISYRLGEEVPFNKTNGLLGENKVASEAFAQMQEHLKDNGLKLDDLTYRLGRVLRFDAAKEKFIGDPEADKLLTREYRAPFVVPEVV